MGATDKRCESVSEMSFGQMGQIMYPDVNEFKKFYTSLMKSAPPDYIPWLFVLEPKGKDPLASRPWADEKSKLSFDGAIRWMDYGHNIGISARDHDALVLIDVDDVDAIPDSDIKPTLSATTRSRVGTHNYYFTTDPKCVCNIPIDHGEIRSCNQYLVCPGGFVTTDIESVPEDQRDFCGYYTLRNQTPPVSIVYDEFPKVFRDHKEHIDNMPMPSRHEPTGHKSKSAMFNLTIDDIISYPKNKYRFPSPFHGSKSGANAAVSNGLLHCFRHLVSHNAIQALAVLSGLYTCQQAGKTHHNGGSGASMVDMRDGETLYHIWQYSRTEGYVPNDDTPPRAALNWFATEAGICKESDITDGWKLPDYAYVEAMRLLRTIPWPKDRRV